MPDKVYLVRTNKRWWLVRRGSTQAARYAVMTDGKYGKDEYVKSVKLAVDHPPFLRAMAEGKPFKGAKRLEGE